MRRTLIFSVVLSLFLLAGAGPAHAETVTVEADDNFFEPKEITIQAGDTIVFENVGLLPHTAQRDEGDFTFDTGNLNAGESAEVTFDEPGTFDYICLYHEALDMVGTITVEGAAGAPPAEEGEEAAGSVDDEGSAEEDPAAEGEGEGEGESAEEGAEDGEAAADDAPPTEKYFPPLGLGLFVLMLLGLGPAVKTFLIPSLVAGKDDKQPEPVGAPPSLEVTATAPPAGASAAPALTAAAPAAAAPAAPAAPAAAPAAAAPAAPPAPAAPTPGPTDPPLDPEKVYQAVLKDETDKGTEPKVAEARAKAAKGRAEEALEMSKAPAAAAPAAAAPAAAPAPAAAAAPAAAPSSAAEPAGPKASDEEAAAIRAKVQEEELAKGSDPRVAEARAKAAEARAKKGTKGPV